VLDALIDLSPEQLLAPPKPHIAWLVHPAHPISADLQSRRELIFRKNPVFRLILSRSPVCHPSDVTIPGISRYLLTARVLSIPRWN